MDPIETLRERYSPIGGDLCLDLANTVSWRETAAPVERLEDPACLAEWTRMVGLEAVAPATPGEAELQAVRTLREATREAIGAAVRHQPPPASAVDELNRCLALAPPPRLAVVGGRLVRADARGGGIEALLARLAHSAADLLGDAGRLARVRICEGEGCGWLFVDDSRGARRRWCSMADCGNRAKARAHYRRKAQLKQA